MDNSAKSGQPANYNSWPLGKLPPEFQRLEPQLIRSEGYDWDDPRDIVKIFERKFFYLSSFLFLL